VKDQFHLLHQVNQVYYPQIAIIILTEIGISTAACPKYLRTSKVNEEL
jgi:hypothetical protein